MYLGFDHVTLVVTDLNYAVKCYKALGYTITDRGDPPGGNTENRLVCFDDGSYIEILQLVDPSYRARHRMTPILSQSGSGWADYSLHSDDIDRDRSRLSACGYDAPAVSDFSKQLASGEKWTVRVMPVGSALDLPAIPFIAMDATPRKLRVPDNATQHENGACGIAGIQVLAANLDENRVVLAALFGEAGSALQPPPGGEKAHRWEVSGHFVELIQPSATPTDLKRHFDLRGEGVYQVFIKNSLKVGIPNQQFTDGGKTVFVSFSSTTPSATVLPKSRGA